MLLFLTVSGTKMTEYAVWLPFFRKCAEDPDKLRFTPHDFRFVFTDWGVKDGVDIEKAAKVLNHSVGIHRTYQRGETHYKMLLTAQYLHAHGHQGTLYDSDKMSNAEDVQGGANNDEDLDTPHRRQILKAEAKER